MKFKKVLVANRGEIAIRIFRACVEMGLKTVAVYTYEDRYSLHRYKADEAYQIGTDDAPLKPYLDMDEIIALAKSVKVDAIHPGYGFLSENKEFARKCKANGIVFVGPEPEVMAALGDKIAAKKVARSVEVPVIEDNLEQSEETTTGKKAGKNTKKSISPAKNSPEAHLAAANRIGFPVILKAASGGGGRGMRICRNAEQLKSAFTEAQNEAEKAFGDATIFIEKFVENPKHVEVQIVADNYGKIFHLYERDCSVQRRFQKVVEIAPSLHLKPETCEKLYEYAIRIAKKVNYNNVGTVEFLLDPEENIYFIEVNPRIQVEHTVTEMITGIDLVKTQIYIAAGFKLSDPEIGIISQEKVLKVGYALQCRITTEDPENDFRPDYGRVIAYRSAAGFGIRLDGGSIYQGVRISPFFDSLLVKVSGHAPDFNGAVMKIDRALQEFRIRGVKTNIAFLENILRHPVFRAGKANVNFIGTHPELFTFKKRLDRGTKVLKFLAETIVNGNPDVKQIAPGKRFDKPVVPHFDPYGAFPAGSKDLLNQVGPEGVTEWLKNQKAIQYTDTTLRDAHQSLLATRMRTIDMVKIAESFAKTHPQTFSMEVWGGATFDVCLRFLHEDPWKRLHLLRQAMPNLLLQMLLRGSNAVGYTAYPDNLIEEFIRKTWNEGHGIDIFRIFDSLNWVKAMETSIRTIRKETGGIAEVCMGYTGDILNGKRDKYNLTYYLQLAKDIENAGAHILAIKDMAGLLKPYAAKELITALKETVSIPIHLHTHDTSSNQPATYLTAIEAGVDVVDVALGALSGLTSQPNFGSVVESTRFHERELAYDPASLEAFSDYWEVVREFYYPFESGLKASSASVYHHEIPGGQYSNLKRQAIELGLNEKWPRILEAYAEVNELFGDIVKVTPSSKVVGDMALLMVSKGFSKQDIIEKGEDISYPESVKSFFRGELGQPYQGFPKKIQKMVLKGEKPFTDKPNKHLSPIDFEAETKAFHKKFDKHLNSTDFLSYKLYPKVFEDYYKIREEFGDIMHVPTLNFFFGLKPNEETIVEIDQGKSIIVKLLSIGEPDADGNRTIFFKLNGQNRDVQVLDRSLNIVKETHPKAESGNPTQVGSPLQGLLSKVMVKKGQSVKKNDALFIIEAMKMENTVVAYAEMEVASVHLKDGTLVEAGDLIITLK